ncbi:hypothetical protein CF319_g9558, partial [Tilletia indica]
EAEEFAAEARDDASVASAGRNAVLQPFGSIHALDNDIQASNLTLAGGGTDDSDKLIGLRQDQALFGFCPDLGRKTFKREEEAGISFFDQHRASTITLHSFSSFFQRFEAISRGVLKNLDFSNIILAGGAVLASVTSNQDGTWCFHPSDIE